MERSSGVWWFDATAPRWWIPVTCLALVGGASTGCAGSGHPLPHNVGVSGGPSRPPTTAAPTVVSTSTTSVGDANDDADEGDDGSGSDGAAAARPAAKESEEHQPVRGLAIPFRSSRKTGAWTPSEPPPEVQRGDGGGDDRPPPDGNLTAPSSDDE